MNKTLEVLKSIWAEIDSIIELFVYLGIAYAIEYLFNIPYLQAVAIVFLYFIMNLCRVYIEILRDKNR
jgi:hypothetical protein